MRNRTVVTLPVRCDKEYYTDDPSELAKLLLAQAIQDDMVAIKLVADLSIEEIEMQYYGPATGGSRQWWDMIPPPAWAYSRLVRAYLELAELDVGIVCKGAINVAVGRRLVTVQLKLPDWTTLQLSWGSIDIPTRK